MTTGLQWQVQKEVLVLSGSLDQESVLLIWSQKETLFASCHVLDVVQLSYVDSAGLALLVRLQGELALQGKNVMIRGASDHLRTLIALYNLNDTLLLD